jgi:hypothetical protein
MPALLLYLFLGLPSSDRPVECSCDKITLNYIYDDIGNIRLTQLILYELDLNKGVWAARQYIIIPEKGANLRISKIDGIYSYWYEEEQVFIKARQFEIVGSDTDLEVDGKQDYKDHLIERDLGITPKAKKAHSDRVKAKLAAKKN